MRSDCHPGRASAPGHAGAADRPVDPKDRLVRAMQPTKPAAEIDLTYTAIKAELEVKRDGLEEKLQKGNAALEVLNEKRAGASKNIPQPVFMRYEFIRRRLEHPVIVGVKEGICSGCHISVPPQSFIELQRGQQILSCPNCQRLIFWCEHFSMEEVAPAPKKPVTLVD